MPPEGPERLCPHGHPVRDEPRHLWCWECAEERAFGEGGLVYSEYRARMLAARRREARG